MLDIDDALLRLLTDAAEGHRPWTIAWPSVYEFLRVVTHPRVLHPPMSIHLASGAASRNW